MSAVVLNGPVLCFLILFGTLMWLSIALLKAVTAPPLAMLRKCNLENMKNFLEYAP